MDDSEVVGPLSGLHLLVVDDNRDARVIYKQLLAHCGAYVSAVASAAAAARALKQIRPDVILTDLSMPGHDGLWLARWIRRREMKTGIHIPVVAITARDDIYERDSMLEIGLDDWLVKPVSHRDLIRVVARLATPLAKRSA
ncbi:MAG TPA: response regulator [Methylomirabilota bacterium]|nr:response regulator [Methylomirabilota bacterium]